MGEADAARMLVSGVDTDRFTPKMVQVAVQSALANADPPALCPIEDGIRKYDAGVRALVQAMCSSLAGEPETASAQIDDARRFGRIGGIDLALAQKVVGAGADTGQAATIEWDPVDQPDRVALRPGDRDRHDRRPTGCSTRPRRSCGRSRRGRRCFRRSSGWIRRSIAAGLGVFSSQTMVDLYSAIYDSTDPSDLADDRRLAASPGLRRQGPGRAHGGDPQGAGRGQGRVSQGGGAGRGGAGGDPDRARRRSAARRAGADLGDAGRGLRPGGGALGRAVARMDDEPGRPLLGDAGARRAGQHRRLVGPDPGLHPPRQEQGQDAQRAARRRACRARPDQHRRRQFAQPPLRARARADDAVDAGDGCGGGARAGGNRAGAHRDRVPDAELRPAAGGAHVPCDHRAEAHRPGLHRADDRGRGAFRGRERRTTERWSTGSST